MPIDKKKLVAGSAIVVFAVGLVAAGRYVALSSQSGANLQIKASSEQADTRRVDAAMPAAGGGKVDSVEVMAERLRARLETDPGDVDGWVLLGRSYHYLERWDEAKAAFARARELGYVDDGGDTTSASPGDADALPGGADSAAVFEQIGRVGSGGHVATGAEVAP